MTLRPSLRQLEYLIALDNHRSFSKAAEHCSISQPALSSAIQDLEELLQQPMIDRSHKKVVLTRLGEEMAKEARDILQRVDTAMAIVKALKSPFLGPLRLGVIPTIAPYFLPWLLPTIKDMHGGVTLQIQEDLSHRLIEKLKNGALDILLMAFPYDLPGMDHAIVCKDEFVFASPKDFVREDAIKHVKTADDIPLEELLLLEDGHCLRDHALESCQKQDFENKRDFSATSLQTIIQMVANGYGVTLLPKMLVETTKLPDSIILKELDIPVPSRLIGFVWRRGSPYRKDFLEFSNKISSLLKD